MFLHHQTVLNTEHTAAHTNRVAQLRNCWADTLKDTLLAATAASPGSPQIEEMQRPWQTTTRRHLWYVQLAPKHEDRQRVREIITCVFKPVTNQQRPIFRLDKKELFGHCLARFTMDGCAGLDVGVQSQFTKKTHHQHWSASWQFIAANENREKVNRINHNLSDS